MRRAVTSVIGLLSCSLLLAQPGPVTAQPSLTFEVASVKPSAPIGPGDHVFFGPPRGGPGTPDPSRITWTYATLRNLLMTAYTAEPYQIAGPDWLNTERYDIAVTLPAGATKDQVSAMWHNLLAQRFGLVLHRESKEFQVEELVIAKSGAKLKESADDPNVPPDGPPVLKSNGELAGPGLITTIMPGPHGATAHSVARAQPLSKVTTMLANALRRPVLDRTGLTGKYDFTVDFVLGANSVPQLAGRPPGPRSSNSLDDAREPGPDLTAAVQQQLGLRLITSKAKLEVLVIDKAQKIPSEN